MLWTDLVALKAQIHEPWILCGDFNVAFKMNERHGAPVTLYEIATFKAGVKEIDVVDIDHAKAVRQTVYGWLRVQRVPTSRGAEFDWVCNIKGKNAKYEIETNLFLSKRISVFKLMWELIVLEIHMRSAAAKNFIREH
ncbi:hypothetical protein QQP08_026832, partial [Theobroma cacao]